MEIHQGQKIGHVTVIKEVATRISLAGNKSRHYLCRCECGTEYEVSRTNLSCRPNISCGCTRFKANKHAGKIYGRLTVEAVKVIEEDGKNRTYFDCICECGGRTLARSDSVTAGKIASCGCIKRELDSIKMKKTRKYFSFDDPFADTEECLALKKIFYNMNSRCSSNAPSKADYHDRGVTICEDWRRDNPKGLLNFLEWALNEGGWAPGYQLDKEAKDQNSLVYSPETCKFVCVSDNASRKRKRADSDYIGVLHNNSVNGKHAFCVVYKSGRFFTRRIYDTREEAAIARDHYIIENNLPHTLNFPELRNEYKPE